MNKPYILFDKSFLQSLNADESLVLDFLYHVSLNPVFLIEVVGDLEKSKFDQPQQENLVQSLSKRTPKVMSSININHLYLCKTELKQTQQIPLKNIPIVFSYDKAIEVLGEKHVFTAQAPELLLLHALSAGRFDESVRNTAKKYRNALESGQLHARLYDLKQHLELLDYKQDDFGSFMKFAREIIYSDKSRLQLMKKALQFFQAPQSESDKIIGEWKKLGAPPLKDFAPYSAYIMLVSLFYQVCEFKNPSLESRKSNWMDLSYLYYLPFCDVFVSNDKLHHKLIPHLAPELNCTFVFGADMKRELSNLVKYFDELTSKPLRRYEEIFSLPTYLPESDEFLVATLYDKKNSSGWRTFYENLIPTMPQETREKLSKKMMSVNKEIEEKIMKGDFSTNEVVDDNELKSKVRFFNFQLSEK